MNATDPSDHDGSGGDDFEANTTQQGSRKEDHAGPACQACRKKKAKCTRTSPCLFCVRNGVECLYDREKGRPGIKPGAIERLNYRLESLENMFLGQSVLWQQLCDQLAGRSESSSSLNEYTERLKDSLSSLGRRTSAGEPVEEAAIQRKSKRQRTEEPPRSQFVASSGFGCDPGDMLPTDLLVDLVELYFAHIHPWIPILHVRQFRQQMKHPEERDKMHTILKAIISVCVRFSDDTRLGSPEAKHALAQSSRQAVILHSMESFSVENLQALIICSFDIIGSGRGPSAWSIVGSMTRTVEQLQLSVEEEDQPRDAQVLVKRIQFLKPCENWSQREARRRVFWNVFLMDRFCSITTGWNVCLTSADVKRRLPCEGAIWEEGNPPSTETPYFGVSGPPDSANGQLPVARPETADQASLGGFAYCIEATENLSLVTSFFLQQIVDSSKARDVQMWLMRFKQLDLRLVQWKVFLPERWQEACAVNEDGNMDPNLTLAHLTHNTAIVLLHQGIAYPSPEWQSIPMKLPSASSAETCMAAATEVSIIAAQFISRSRFLTNPQFAFCLFVCGRMLISHASYYSVALSDEFDSLVGSLRTIANRWNGLGPHTEENLASKFALRLEHARRSGIQVQDMREAAYPNHSSGLNGDGLANGMLNSDRGAPDTYNALSGPLGTYGEIFPVAFDQGESPDSITLAYPPLPLAFQAQPSNRSHMALHPNDPGSSIQNGSKDFNGQVQKMPSHGPADADISMHGMSAFLDYSLLPDQRVSTYSQFRGLNS